MAVLTFNSNPPSVTIQGNLSRTNDALGQNLERLSSGLRINKASDDPAGLMLAETLRTDSRILTQAIKNVSDGISLVSTADSAAQELSSILAQLKELATQAYNSVTTSSQRSSLHSEAIALASEYDRIVAETSFNTQKLLDGSLQNMSIQAGPGSSAEIRFSLGQNIGDLSILASATVGSGTFQSVVSYSALGTSLYNFESADFDGDGDKDILSVQSGAAYATIMLNNGDGTFTAATTASIIGTSGHLDIITGDFNGDSKQDYISVTSLSAWVFLGNGNGTFAVGVSYNTGTASSLTLASGDFNEDGKSDLVVGNSVNGSTFVLLGNGNGTFNYDPTGDAGGLTSYNLAVADLNGDGYDDVVSPGATSTGVFIRLGNGDGTFKAPVTYVGAASANLRDVAIGDLNEDGYNDLVVGANANSKLDVLLGNGDGTFKAFVSYNNASVAPVGVRLADLNGDGNLDVFSGGTVAGPVGYMTISLGNGDGTFKAPTSNVSSSTGGSYINVTDYTGDGVVDVALLQTGPSPDRIDIFKANTTITTATSYINLLTQSNALLSLSIIDVATSALAIEFGAIAGADSRLSTAVNLLAKTRDTLDLARSRIVDADVAQEVAELVRNQILQQSGVAMLAQANIAPALALSLLEDF